MRESERVYAFVRSEILHWVLGPGTVLGEVELSTRLGVSRTPLREALRRLEREKLVDIKPGRGAVVAEISMHDVAQIFQMREAIETYAVRLAARRHDEQVFLALLTDLTAAWQALDPTTAPVEGYGKYSDLIARFDTAVAEAAENAYLTDVLDMMSAHVTRLRHLARRNPERMHKAAEEHVAICQAILGHDADAAGGLVADHIHNSLRAVLSVFMADVTGSGLVLFPARTVHAASTIRPAQ